MSEKRHSSVPGMPVIPQDVIDRFQRENDPSASEEDVRQAILEANAGPPTTVCPTCGGAGVLSEQQVHELRRARATEPPPDEIMTAPVKK